MKLLLIGGTQFLGRHLAEQAQARGYELTLFNRGRTGSAPTGARTLVGDRKADLGALADAGPWDAVIDTCGYLPRDVARMAEALHGRVARYLFVSSISVYASFEQPREESAPVAVIDDVDTEVIDGRTYGALKALCEAAVVQRFGSAASLIVRPGLIVGPHDPTQRFTYWPARLARAHDGESVLAPGHAADAVQFIDVRDLARFMLDALQAGRHGVFNATSPPGLWSIGQLLRACALAADCSPRWVWADAATLEELGLKPWSDLPVWLPLEGEHAGMPFTSTRAAQAAGLRCRELIDTVQDTLDWWRGLPAELQEPTRAGLSAQREAAALQAIALRPPKTEDEDGDVD